MRKRTRLPLRLSLRQNFQTLLMSYQFSKKVSLSINRFVVDRHLKKDYKSFLEKLVKGNKDSLSLEDARSLCDKYFMYSFNKRSCLLAGSLIDNKYRQTFPAIKAVNWAGVASC